MTLLLVLLALVAASTARLAQVVACDGLGTCAPPRSHAAELGSWVDWELGR